MRILFFAIILTLTLAACSDNQNESTENNEQKEVKVTSHNEDSNNNEEVEQEEREVEEIEPFWEVYTGEELVEAVEEGEKEFNFEIEAPLFEEALLNRISNGEEVDDDWMHYIMTFSSNLKTQPPDDYAIEIYQSAMDYSSGDSDKALERIEKAKEIREEHQ